MSEKEEKENALPARLPVLGKRPGGFKPPQMAAAKKFIGTVQAPKSHVQHAFKDVPSEYLYFTCLYCKYQPSKKVR
jgi:hypothetical protein